MPVPRSGDQVIQCCGVQFASTFIVATYKPTRVHADRHIAIEAFPILTSQNEKH